MRLRFVACLFFVTVLRPLAGAEVDSLVSRHIEALGGRERIKSLTALRASGVVAAGKQQMRFTMIAARPDRVRLETETGGRTLVQAYDGRHPAWEFDTGDWPPRYHDMAAGTAKTFVADAEFEDPLVGGDARGFSLEYAGRVEGEGKQLLRILVTRRLTETYAVLLDPDTLMILRRIEDRPNPLGGTSHIVTFYSDYRPVAGVLLPFKVALVIDNQVKQQTSIETVQPNPPLADNTFSRPLVAGTGKK